MLYSNNPRAIWPASEVYFHADPRKHFGSYKLGQGLYFTAA